MLLRVPVVYGNSIRPVQRIAYSIHSALVMMRG